MPRWTQEARLKQAAIQKTRQSWRHSTGPKTLKGKARSKMNAQKHGCYSAPHRQFRSLLRAQAVFLKRVQTYVAQERRRARFDHIPEIPDSFYVHVPSYAQTTPLSPAANRGRILSTELPPPAGCSARHIVFIKHQKDTT